MTIENASIDLLKIVKKILDSNKIDYWLDEGTLLGAVREKKFIEWDHDIDLGLWIEAVSKIESLFREFEKEGIGVCFHNELKHIKLVKNKVETDINPYTLLENKATRKWYKKNRFGKILDYLIWTLNLSNENIRLSNAPLSITRSVIVLGKIIPKWKKKYLLKILFILFEKIGSKTVKIEIPSVFFNKLKDLMFYKLNFKVPADTEKYLEYRYGKDWKIPKRDYVYTKDDKSIVKSDL